MKNFWEDFDTEDFTMPRVTIGMGSPTKGKVGHFNSSTGESFSELSNVSLLGRTPGFVLYGGLGAVPARCASNDGINPHSGIENPVTAPEDGGCSACYANKWGPDARKDALRDQAHLTRGGDKPICNQTLSLLLAGSDGMPFVLLTKTHNVKVVREFLFTGLRMRAAAHRLEPYGMAFDLRLLALSGLGNRYQLVVENWQRVLGDRLQANRGLYEAFGPKAQMIVSHQHKALDDKSRVNTATGEVDEMGF